MLIKDYKQKQGDWQRTSRSHPCPICGKPDWCMFAGPANDPTAAICQRIESTKPVGTKGAGWLHVFRADNWIPTRIRRHVVYSTPPTDVNFSELAGKCAATLGPDYRKSLSLSLGVSQKSLSRLGAGWPVEHKAYSFPMSDADGNVCGIRLRNSFGRKWAVKGSRQGLFLPASLDCVDLLLICEGPTDTAAILDLGFEAVGRPSCSGGVLLLIDLVRKQQPQNVVIVADHDAPGKRGAHCLATSLAPYVPAVRIISPPIGVKDARQWRCQGATHWAVMAAITEAPPLGLTVVVGRATA